jgi:hypothetical protein
MEGSTKVYYWRNGEEVKDMTAVKSLSKVKLDYQIEYKPNTVTMLLTPAPGQPAQSIKIIRQLLGRLFCRYCSSLSCEHIGTLINDHADAPLLFVPDAEIEGQTVEVPLVAKHDLYASVKFDKVTPEPFSAFVSLLISPEVGGWTNLGFINEGEGRAVLRGMIYDWFRGCADKDGLRCKISAHSMVDQMNLEKDLKTVTYAFAQQWSLFTTGMCLNCNQSMQDFDDAVPF